MSMAVAFLRRDWLRHASYRLRLVWQIVGLLVYVALVYAIGTTLGDAAKFPGDGTGYVKFVLAGLGFTDVFFTSMTAFPHALREAQLAGTLEPMLLAPIRVPQLVWGSSLFGFLQSCVRVVIVVVVAALAFGYWHDANVVTAAVVLVPGCLVFGAMGLLSASFVLAFKQGDPVLPTFGFVSSLLGGALFPVSALPEWAQPFGAVLPLTHALTGMRLALDGADPGSVLPQVAILSSISLVLLPVALISFHAALDRAKREGSLVHY
jgi:ABC-2 type transport system permease protein